MLSIGENYLSDLPNEGMVFQVQNILLGTFQNTPFVQNVFQNPNFSSFSKDGCGTHKRAS